MFLFFSPRPLQLSSQDRSRFLQGHRGIDLPMLFCGSHTFVEVLLLNTDDDDDDDYYYYYAYYFVQYFQLQLKTYSYYTSPHEKRRMSNYKYLIRVPAC